MALTIEIAGPLGTVRMLTTPNNKIEKHATTIGVERDDYATDLDYEVAIITRVADNILRPHKQAQSQIDGANPDVSDVITVS